MKTAKRNELRFLILPKLIKIIDQKGLKFDNKFKLCITNFGVESSKIFQIIIDHVKNNEKNFQEISFWLDDARRNWDTIDKYTQFISAFKDLEEYKNDKKVKNFFH